MFRRSSLTLLAAIFAGLSASGQAQQPSSIANLKTTAEASDFKSTSTYEDVVKFMKAVDAASPNIFYTTYGKTSEGREMPLAVVGTGLKDASAASVRATNRLRVHIQGNIHAGEVEGKERRVEPELRRSVQELGIDAGAVDREAAHEVRRDGLVARVRPFVRREGLGEVADEGRLLRALPEARLVGPPDRAGDDVPLHLVEWWPGAIRDAHLQELDDMFDLLVRDLRPSPGELGVRQERRDGRREVDRDVHAAEELR